jgi:hypothetical protein
VRQERCAGRDRVCRGIGCAVGEMCRERWVVRRDRCTRRDMVCSGIGVRVEIGCAEG